MNHKPKLVKLFDLSSITKEKMVIKSLLMFICCLTLVLPLPVAAQVQNPDLVDDMIKQRQELAASGQFLYDSLFANETAAIQASAPNLAAALDVSSPILQSASIVGSDAANGVFNGLGVIRPENGNSFALLSSGIAGTGQPEPGIDFGNTGTDGDQVRLTLTLAIPAGANRLGFVYNFLSAESPDFIGSIYNDTFTALLTDSTGVREIARASVNSSVFIPVSESNAGGSGFDLFTPDPSAVDNVFGSGSPDAGLTSFETINVPVTGGETVTLEFTVEDRGDGILDSAVILDNLIVSSFEIVDPNPIFLSNGQIKSNPQNVAQGGETRVGAAADGVTRVLLRNKVAGQGTVEFCLVNSAAPQDGGLALLGGAGRATCVNAPVASTTQGFMGFAIYQTPDEFNRGGDGALAERPIRFRARFTPTTGSPTTSEMPFKLVRPPVVLIHGIWSDGGTWTFPLVADQRFSITGANYSDTNASSFSVNLNVSDKFIRQAVTKFRQAKIAATQVDIAAHSMGGILSRNHVSRANYKNNENFNAGDVNKLITLNTPHTGSPLANLAQSLRDNFAIGGLFKSKMRENGRPVDQGAVDDLAEGSAAINSIQQTQIPSHALVGLGGANNPEDIPGSIGTIHTIINLFGDSGDVFHGQQHDGIVNELSQKGGMPSSATTSFIGLESIHCCVPDIGGATNSHSYSDRVIQLLNSSANSSLFAEFPAPASLPTARVAELDTRIPSVTAPPASVNEGGLLITAPANGTQVAPGATVHVVVTPQSGVIVDKILLVGPDVAELDNVAPFEFDLLIPVHAIGTFGISAVGKQGTDTYYTSNTVTLQVIPTVNLQAIVLVPEETILFAVGESEHLIVFGNYEDNTVRDITSPAAGTIYFSSDPNIVSVSPEGKATAMDVGTATIVAQNGSLQDSVSVNVLLPNQPPVANAGPDQTATAGSLVTLNGNNSFDPDNEPQPLSYEWFQISGPEVTLANPTTANPTFTPVQDGTYTFSLIVRDGQADSPPDSVNITVGSLLPVAPSNLSAGAASQTQINLSWIDNSNNESGFKIERSPNGSTNWSQIDTVGVNGTNYANSGLTCGTTYYYRVRAYNVGGDSAYSNGANTQTTACSSTDPIFADSFESGDFSKWSFSFTNGGRLSVSGNAARVGTYGAQITTDVTHPAYLADDRPAAEPRYRARFYFHPNSVTMANKKAHPIFYGVQGGGTAIMRIGFQKVGNKYQLRASLLNDATTWKFTKWVTISNAWHALEVDWQASTTTSAKNGSLTFWIDGAQKAIVTKIDNDTRRIDGIWLGPLEGGSVGMQGSYYFDDFVSRRQSYIGPAASVQSALAVETEQAAETVNEEANSPTTVVSTTIQPGAGNVLTGEFGGLSVTAQAPVNTGSEPITVKLTSTDTQTMPDGYTLVGDMFTMRLDHASGTAPATYDQPVTLTIDYAAVVASVDQQVDISLQAWNAEAERWEIVPATVNAADHTISALLNQGATLAVWQQAATGVNTIYLPAIQQ